MNEPRLFGVSPDEFRRLRDIFESALGRPPAERSHYVERACAGDAALIGEVERMLRADCEHHRFLDGSVLRGVHWQGAHDIPLDSSSARMTTAATSAGSNKRSAAHLPIGSSVNGRYRVEGVIGEGGMGVVYRVRDDLHPDRALALKTIRNQDISAAQLALFKAEFRTMAQLKHPHIAAVYDFEAIQGTDEHCYTLDYVDGSNIFDATSNQEWKPILDLLVGVAQALAYIHSRKIAHLDLKPANVLLASSRFVKVLDFGLAAAWARLDQGTMCGTPAYMAPEMFEGTVIDHRADLYALGIMAYQLLCRRVPFSATALNELWGKHRSEPIAFSDRDRERLPDWLRYATQKLCAKQAADRYGSAAIFIEAVNRQGGLAYEVETEQTRDSYLLSSRFVGREHELGRVSEFIAHRIGGQEVRAAPAMCVVGPSGIGKSRLMTQVRQQVQLQGTSFIEAKCVENAFDEYGPVADLVSHAARMVTAAGGAAIIERYGPELIKIAPELAASHSFIASPPMPDAADERARLHAQVADFFLAVSELVPYVAYVDDLQWARAGTADLIGALFSSIDLREKRLGRRVRLCLLGSYRNDEIVSRPFARIIDRQLADIIELKSLSRDQVGELVASMLGVEEPPAAFVERISREAAGNAFFIQEIMRALVNTGAVYVQGGEWATREEIGTINIPISLASLLERRAALLSSRERELFTLFAVFGRDLPFDVGLQLGGYSENELAELLLGLERKQILQCVDEDRLRFCLVHDRLRESHYASLPEQVRVQWHQRIAESIERTFEAGLEPYYYDLSLHFARSGRAEAALRYSLLGARRAKAASAHGAAIEMLERALSLTHAADQRRQIETELADEHSLVGGYDRALGLYEGLLAGSQDPLERARLYRGVSTIHFYRGDMQPSLDAIWQSVGLLGGAVPGRGKVGVIIGTLGALCTLGIGKLRGFARPKDANERAKSLELASTYQRMSTLYYFVFPPGMMLVNLRAWLAARPWGPSEQLAQAYAVLAFIVGGVLGKHALAARLAKAALQTVQQVESPSQEGFVRARIGALAVFRGDYSEAISHLGQAKRSLQQFGDYAELGFAWVNLSQAYYFQGRFREGYALALEGYEMFERIGSDMVARQFLSMVAVMGALIGIKGEIAKVRDGIARSQLCRDYTCQCIGMVKLGAVHAALGEYDSALSALEQARRVRTEHGVKFHYADMLDILELDIRLRMPEASPAMLARALTQNRRIARARPAYAAWVALNEANHAALAGRRRQALAHYDRAREIATRQGARHLLANVHVDMARADPANARAHLQQALTLHRECGAVHDERVVEEALRDLAASLVMLPSF